MSQRLDAALWKQLLQHGAGQHQGLQAQVRAMVVEAILDGLLPPHTPLPSSRELAQALGVARNTVVLAYQQLADEGYVQPRERSGYFVSPDITAGRVRGASAAALASAASSPSRRPDWQARFKQHPSALRSILKPPDWQRYPYPFL
jgi:GntR family transcriptional regulator/MocR family aminotransferase